MKDRKETVIDLAATINGSGFKASALRSVLVHLVECVKLPEDEIVYLLRSVAEEIEKGS
jgi:hypothetical protein